MNEPTVVTADFFRRMERVVSLVISPWSFTFTLDLVDELLEDMTECSAGRCSNKRRDEGKAWMVILPSLSCEFMLISGSTW